MQELSENAKKLLDFLKKTGGAWEHKCMEELYPKPKYVSTNEKGYTAEQITEIQSEFWQWSANAFGVDEYRPVCGFFMNFLSKDNYSQKTSQAYRELKKLGLAYEANSGFNDYYFYPTKK